MLRNVVGNRAGDCVLKQALVGDKAVAINRLDLVRIKIHRHHADEYQHTQDYIQNRYAGWKKFGAQVSLLRTRTRLPTESYVKFYFGRDRHSRFLVIVSRYQSTPK